MMAGLPHPVLVADIGGTNCRISLVAEPGQAHRPVARIGTGAFSSPEDAFESVLAAEGVRPASAVLAVAGPLDGRRAQLTNAGWAFDGPAIAARLGLRQGLLVNDFEALAAGLAELGPPELHTLVPGRPEPGGLRLVLGPGTGFGAAAALERDGRGVLIPTEAGHIGIGPEDPTEEKLWPFLARSVPRLTVETVLSGDGLVRLHRAVAAQPGMDEPEISAADVTTLAIDGDPAALKTVVTFWRLLARVAGDLALAFKATGGVYVAGGIVPRLLPLADRDALAAIFAAKPPMEDLAARFALHVVTAHDAAERGLAAIAADPRRFGLDDSSRLWFG